MEALDNWADIVDSRNIVDRVNELQDQQMAHHEDQEDQDPDDRVPWSAVDPDAADELRELEELLAQLRNVGGDTPEGGQALIRENYLSDYVKELYMECTDRDLLKRVTEQLEGPWKHVDWAAVAEDERSDYTEVTWAGVTYYVR